MNELYPELEELMRETFEGAKPGQGTQYLDRDGGVLTTLAAVDAPLASARPDGRTSIAAHVRHPERAAYLGALRALPPDRLLADGGGPGVIAHLAYHLGAIRQRIPRT